MSFDHRGATGHDAAGISTKLQKTAKQSVEFSVDNPTWLPAEFIVIRLALDYARRHLASLGRVFAFMLFSWYAANFGNTNQTYGSLDAGIGFMMWMWLSAPIILVGAELNAEIENQARSGPKRGESKRCKT